MMIISILLAQVVVLRNGPIRVQHLLGCPTEQINARGAGGRRVLNESSDETLRLHHG